MLLEHTLLKYKKNKKKSISGYNFDILFKSLEKSIERGHPKDSLYFLNEINASGYYQELYNFFINYTIRYIHINNISLIKEIIISYNQYLLLKKTFNTTSDSLLNIRENITHIKTTIKILKNILASKKSYLYDHFPGSYLPENNNKTIIPNIDISKMKKSDLNSIIKYYDSQDMSNVENLLTNFIISFMDYYEKRNYRDLNKSLMFFHEIIYKEIQILDIGIDNEKLTEKTFVDCITKISKFYVNKLWVFFLKLAKNTVLKKKMIILFNLYKSKFGNLKELLFVGILLFIKNNKHEDKIFPELDKEITYYNFLYKNIDNSYYHDKPRIDFKNVFSSREEKENFLLKNDAILQQEKSNMILKKIIPKLEKEKKLKNYMKEYNLDIDKLPQIDSIIFAPPRIIKTPPPVEKIKTITPKKSKKSKNTKDAKNIKIQEEFDEKFIKFNKIISEDYELTETDLLIKDEMKGEEENFCKTYKNIDI